MKQVKKTIPLMLSLAIASLSLLSFKPMPGGDKFEIYLNNKLVVEQYVSMKPATRHLALQPSNYNDRIDIRYSHCGTTGTQRTIVVKDEKNKILRKWEFANAKGSNTNMSWKVKEIMDLQKDKDHVSLKLYYSSHELPEGRLLATVTMANSGYVKR